MNDRAPRLYFLDWIRICAFFLLILYHTGMYYVSWDWHVKSPHAGSAIEPLMMLSSPWRLGLLFLISGAALSFLLQKLGGGAVVRQRSARLLLPLVFGMFVIVPPQPYFEVVEKVAYGGSYLDFMRLYVSAYPGFCRGDDCLDMPTWNHLWFVAYLWAYTLLLAGLFAALGARWQRLSDWLGRTLTGWRIVALPLAVLAIARVALLNRFPTTHDLVNDWYNHANYLTLFLLGALLARQPDWWRRVEALRFAALGIALACWAILVPYFAITQHMDLGDVGLWRDLQRVIYALCQWCAILAVCGFGHRHLQFDSAKRHYLTRAVFPVYILHQTLIVLLSQALKPAALPPATEGLILVVLTLTGSFGIFEVVRRVPPLRPLFGIAPAGEPADRADRAPVRAAA
ncbi:acyltransferase family protein [Pseudoduganella namucuonensis]|uniref:Acyltransferase family protein n=1 Tax=Pseudoduganella namucuonensis TaxID=1035707 RepID=A0A1I7JFY3_9BURK|nr:acyltransferase family protein [Pseudoduganella namucuonensis]SFU84078.1 Acyltransferase family protein [Pseudoduganella namucuonensis]